ncbi:ribonuclease P protein component [Antarcticibacterium sp. 1MA-6-2]|uniref:ribonuclease P protein component n=1 Tax=Antarcticibacterium sp. 1MA-6-2 TaxID=2908210 RepID=UPI001F220B68|nr:ribonuclease P protein component [Antarcticibacterium sp. 1MA-6-2]UJH93005.1 ribonuclease P protein component [Antarcticibacterium sp. 1MA-6-2]
MYLPLKDEEMSSHKTGVSVPKRSFKKAVDRNFLKRLMREAFRKNKYLVDNNLSHKFAFIFIFTGKKIVDYQQVNSGITAVLKQLHEKEGANEKECK